jgi:hypothetical protein
VERTLGSVFVNRLGDAQERDMAMVVRRLEEDKSLDRRYRLLDLICARHSNMQPSDP